MEAQHELELFLGLLLCFLKNPPTLGPWTLLVVQGDDASPKETAMWKIMVMGPGSLMTESGVFPLESVDLF